MTNQATPRFMVIDDDPINNLICSKFIRNAHPDAQIQTFTEPVRGLDFIASHYMNTDNVKTVLFLDINMPVLSGWDVLNSFKNFTQITKEQFIIYILSSSIASEDKERAANSPLVKGYIEKPLSLGLIQAILNGSN